MGADGLPGDRDVVPEMVNRARFHNRIAVCLLNRIESAISFCVAGPNSTHEGWRPYSWLWVFVDRPTMLRSWNWDRVHSGETTEGRKDAM